VYDIFPFLKKKGYTFVNQRKIQEV
jgi:hypothetical protein